MRPQAPITYSSDRGTAMNQMYGSTSVDISQHINQPLERSNVLRGVSLVAKASGGIVPFMAYAFIIQPLQHAVMDYVGDKINSQTPDVTYDVYTESILAEVMSSQQTESKLESAPRFIRPKRKKRLYR